MSVIIVNKLIYSLYEQYWKSERIGLRLKSESWLKKAELEKIEF